MSFKNEFPDFDWEELPEIEGFVDNSWHNDSCPSLIRDIGDKNFLRVFVNYLDESMHEGFNTNFMLMLCGNLGDEVLCEVDSIQELKYYIYGFLFAYDLKGKYA